MTTEKQAEEEPEERSRAAGACVLVVLGGGGLAVVFAVSETAGVLTVWAIGAVALFRAARRMSDSSATPPPRGVPPRSGVDAGQSRKDASAIYDPIGVMCIYHESPEGEVNDQ